MLSTIDWRERTYVYDKERLRKYIIKEIKILVLAEADLEIAQQ